MEAIKIFQGMFTSLGLADMTSCALYVMMLDALSNAMNGDDVLGLIREMLLAPSYADQEGFEWTPQEVELRHNGQAELIHKCLEHDTNYRAMTNVHVTDLSEIQLLVSRVIQKVICDLDQEGKRRLCQEGIEYPV